MLIMATFTLCCWLALKLLLLILIADFLTGVVHFWMDQYGREDMPFVGRHVIEINILHHQKPRHMLKKNYWQLTWTSWLLGAIVAVFAWFLGRFSWEIAFVIIAAANANLVHQWAHKTPEENGRVITWLQDWQVLQSRAHHGLHHHAPYDTQFCILTNLLNPILHTVRFWEFVVWVLRRVGIQPVAGTNIRGFV
jgi:plasmanylethanolamine desaturase